MKILSTMAAAVISLGAQAVPALAGGTAGPQHGAQIHQSQVNQRWQQSHAVREPVQQDASGVRGQAHTSFGGPRLDQRPDPNFQNPYRPMFSPNAVNPGEQHPYFQTPKAGFGYPTGNPEIYQGNGFYVIPR
jgi:hypothetical protein